MSANRPSKRASEWWVCTVCGEPTGQPDVYTLLDPRYAAGRCGTKGCTSGLRPLIRGDAFDESKFRAERRQATLAALHQKLARGTKFTKKEAELYAEAVKSGEWAKQ